MKKTVLFCAGMVVAMAFTSCKSSESAYKQAYEKAKAQEAAAVVEETTPVVAPVVATPVTETKVVDNTDNVAVRTENLSVVTGSPLKAYSVVVGAYKVKANAEAEAKRMAAKGYDSRLVYNAERDMYRVVASSFDSKSDAVNSRNQLRSDYPEAWLLYQK